MRGKWIDWKIMTKEGKIENTILLDTEAKPQMPRRREGGPPKPFRVTPEIQRKLFQVKTKYKE